MEKFSQLVTWMDGKVWGWGMILLLLGTHLFMTVRTGFIQRKNNHKRNQAFRIQRTGCRR